MELWIGLLNEPVENNNNSSSLILDTLECCGISSTNNGEKIMEKNSMKNMKAKENHRSFLYIGRDYDPIKISYGNVKSTDTIIQPLNETIIRHGPFITNTEKEMKQAILDYQNGKMGVLD